MTDAEKRILLGLYLSSHRVDHEIVYEIYEPNWLIHNKLSAVKDWRNPKSGFKTFGGNSKSDDSYDDYVVERASVKSSVEKALSYLKGKHYIHCEKRDQSTFKISVTIEGCDIARDLQTCFGRWNLRYKEHEDGILWFIVTVLTSLVVALITTWISKD